MKSHKEYVYNTTVCMNSVWCFTREHNFTNGSVRFGFGNILCKDFSFDKFMIRICHYKFSGNDKMSAKQNSCTLNIEKSNPVECFYKYYV